MGSDRRLLLASQNPGKAREIARILEGWEILSLADFAPVDFPEEGDDYEANARAKAVAAARATGLACVADDSGLEVEALGGAPGPYSARYGGQGLDDRGRLLHLLAELDGTPAPRRARFYCVAACGWPDGQSVVASGACEGEILDAPRGAGGFGYDPVFRPEGHDRAMAELSREEKDGLSHRGRAFAALEARIIARLVCRERDASSDGSLASPASSGVPRPGRGASGVGRVTARRTPLLLIRHGQTPWNVEGRWQGHADVGLTVEGEAQARAVARTLAQMPTRPWTRIFSSDLRRAHRTARAIGTVLELAVATDARLRERDVGRWSGLTRDEIERRDPENLRAWDAGDSSVRLGGGESTIDVRARVIEFVAEVADRHQGEQLIVVTHLGVIRSLVPDAVRDNGGCTEAIAEALLAASAEPDRAHERDPF